MPTGLGLGLGFGFASTSGGGASGPVQQIGTRAEPNLAISGALTTLNQRMSGRARMYFSEDCNNIQMGFNGYWIADINGSNICVETNLTADYNMRVALEYNGVSIPLTWGGTGSGTIPAGSALTLTDKLPASAFGLSKFTKGDIAWIRMDRTSPVGANGQYHYANANSPAITGEMFQSGGTSATDFLTATGDWPRTNGWTALAVVFLPCCVIGETALKKKASGIIGASIEHGAGETGRGDGFNDNGGYVRRAFVSGKEAKIMLTKPGESAVSYAANSAKRQALYPYVNTIYSAHGGNDYSYAVGVSATQAALTTIWAAARANGRKVHHIGLSPKTDSTDVWVTEVNQTPRTGFATGGNWRDAVNTWSLGKVGTEITSFYDMDDSQTPYALGSGNRRDIWRADLGQASIDGTHPTTPIHTAMGTAFATKLASDRAAYEA